MNYVVEQLLKPAWWRYMAQGITRRRWQPCKCPSCHGMQSKRVDRKFAYTLHSCDQCKLLFRYPYETPEEMDDFYQDEYEETGLITDLPDDAELARLMSENFRGTNKDFSYLPGWLEALSVPRGARVLDYGASWGYCAYQLRNAGYDVSAFEISKPRAKFGLKLGIQIATSQPDVSASFDVVFSNHVLEHVPNPLQSIHEQIRLTKPGGYVIAQTPNGSEELQKTNQPLFHSRWRRVHPVLLNDAFLTNNFGSRPIYQASAVTPEALRQWNGNGSGRAPLTGEELTFIIKV